MLGVTLIVTLVVALVWTLVVILVMTSVVTPVVQTHGYVFACFCDRAVAAPAIEGVY